MSHKNNKILRGTNIIKSSQVERVLLMDHLEDLIENVHMTDIINNY